MRRDFLLEISEYMRTFLPQLLPIPLTIDLDESVEDPPNVPRSSKVADVEFDLSHRDGGSFSFEFSGRAFVVH